MTFTKPEHEPRLASSKQIDLILKICKWRNISPPLKLIRQTLTMDEAGEWIDNHIRHDKRVYK